MSHHWLLITFSWFGTVSLQYINSEGPAEALNLNNIDPAAQYTYPFIQQLINQPHDSDTTEDQLYQEEESRKRKTLDESDKKWSPNLVDTDKTVYLKTDDKSLYENETEFAKRNFSPWGGKRGGFENIWTWKRTLGVREPSMPKRVRFSPWGGKRSGQMIFKPGNKGSRVIFSPSVPELTRILSNFNPNGGLSLAGISIIPVMDKRHPIKFLSFNTKMDERSLRDALPLQLFMESMPKLFKPGQTYTDVHLKKDGKRKVKFSAWGGKRAPPIIGPIWTPAPQDVKDSTLNTILLIRKLDEKAS